MHWSLPIPHHLTEYWLTAHIAIHCLDSRSDGEGHCGRTSSNLRPIPKSCLCRIHVANTLLFSCVHRYPVFCWVFVLSGKASTKSWFIWFDMCKKCRRPFCVPNQPWSDLNLGPRIYHRYWDSQQNGCPLWGSWVNH